MRTVRNFGGSRFKRSTEEGFLEEFLLEDEVYNDIDANFSSVVVVDNDERAFGEKISLHFGKRSVKCCRIKFQLRLIPTLDLNSLID